MTKPTSPAANASLPTPRRAFLRLIVTLPLVAAPIAAAAYAASSETDPDAELIERGEQLAAAWTAERATLKRLEGDESEQADQITDAAFERLPTLLTRSRN